LFATATALSFHSCAALSPFSLKGLRTQTTLLFSGHMISS
jgi:hypothetical protein